MSQSNDGNFQSVVILGLKTALLEAENEINRLKSKLSQVEREGLQWYLKCGKTELISIKKVSKLNEIKNRLQQELKTVRNELEEQKKEMADKENENINLQFKVKEIKSLLDIKIELLESLNIKGNKVDKNMFNDHRSDYKVLLKNLKTVLRNQPGYPDYHLLEDIKKLIGRTDKGKPLDISKYTLKKIKTEKKENICDDNVMHDEKLNNGYRTSDEKSQCSIQSESKKDSLKSDDLLLNTNEKSISLLVETKADSDLTGDKRISSQSRGNLPSLSQNCDINESSFFSGSTEIRIKPLIKVDLSDTAGKIKELESIETTTLKREDLTLPLIDVISDSEGDETSGFCDGETEEAESPTEIECSSSLQRLQNASSSENRISIQCMPNLISDNVIQIPTCPQNLSTSTPDDQSDSSSTKPRVNSKLSDSPVKPLTIKKDVLMESSASSAKPSTVENISKLIVIDGEKFNYETMDRMAQEILDEMNELKQLCADYPHLKQFYDENENDSKNNCFKQPNTCSFVAHRKQKAKSNVRPPVPESNSSTSYENDKFKARDESPIKISEPNKVCHKIINNHCAVNVTESLKNEVLLNTHASESHKIDEIEIDPNFFKKRDEINVKKDEQTEKATENTKTNEKLMDFNHPIFDSLPNKKTEKLDSLSVKTEKDICIVPSVSELKPCESKESRTKVESEIASVSVVYDQVNNRSECEEDTSKENESIESQIDISENSSTKFVATYVQKEKTTNKENIVEASPKKNLPTKIEENKKFTVSNSTESSTTSKRALKAKNKLNKNSEKSNVLPTENKSPTTRRRNIPSKNTKAKLNLTKVPEMEEQNESNDSTTNDISAKMNNGMERRKRKGKFNEILDLLKSKRRRASDNEVKSPPKIVPCEKPRRGRKKKCLEIEKTEIATQTNWSSPLHNETAQDVFAIQESIEIVPRPVEKIEISSDSSHTETVSQIEPKPEVKTNSFLSVPKVHDQEGLDGQKQKTIHQTNNNEKHIEISTDAEQQKFSSEATLHSDRNHVESKSIFDISVPMDSELMIEEQIDVEELCDLSFEFDNRTETVTELGNCPNQDELTIEMASSVACEAEKQQAVLKIEKTSNVPTKTENENGSVVEVENSVKFNIEEKDEISKKIEQKSEIIPCFENVDDNGESEVHRSVEKIAEEETKDDSISFEGNIDKFSSESNTSDEWRELVSKSENDIEMSTESESENETFSDDEPLEMSSKLGSKAEIPIMDESSKLTSEHCDLKTISKTEDERRETNSEKTSISHQVQKITEFDINTAESEKIENIKRTSKVKNSTSPKANNFFGIEKRPENKSSTEITLKSDVKSNSLPKSIEHRVESLFETSDPEGPDVFNIIEEMVSFKKYSSVRYQELVKFSLPESYAISVNTKQTNKTELEAYFNDRSTPKERTREVLMKSSEDDDSEDEMLVIAEEDQTNGDGFDGIDHNKFNSHDTNQRNDIPPYAAYCPLTSNRLLPLNQFNGDKNQQIGKRTETVTKPDVNEVNSKTATLTPGVVPTVENIAESVSGQANSVKFTFYKENEITCAEPIVKELSPFEKVWESIKSTYVESPPIDEDDMVIPCYRAVTHMAYYYKQKYNAVQPPKIKEEHFKMKKIKESIYKFLEEIRKNEFLAVETFKSSVNSANPLAVAIGLMSVTVTNAKQETNVLKETLGFLVTLCIGMKKDQENFLTTVKTVLRDKMFAKTWDAGRNNEINMIPSVIALSIFYTMLCKQDGDVKSVRELLYDSLCNLKFRAHPIAYGVLTACPTIFYELSKHCLLTQIILFTLINHAMEYNPLMYKLPEVQEIIGQYYNLRLGYKAAEDFAREAMLQFNDDTWVDAIVLLCKRQQFSWSYRNVVMKYLLQIVNRWKEHDFSEMILIKTVQALHKIVRCCPMKAVQGAQEMVVSNVETPSGPKYQVYNIDLIVTSLADILHRKKGSRELYETVALALCDISHLNFKLCSETLHDWIPPDKVISNKTLQKLNISMKGKRIFPSWFQFVAPHKFAVEYKAKKPWNKRRTSQEAQNGVMKVGISQNSQVVMKPKKKKKKKKKSKR